MPQGISPNPLNKISEVYLSQISEHHKKDADGNTIPHEDELDEAKVDTGRSDYGKASIRNYRRMGPGHDEPGMFDPEGKRGKTIEKRREEHKARRGVKGAKVPAYKVDEGTSYGLYKGSGKPSGAMKKYLDKRAKMLQKKRDSQSDAAKNNPHFDSTVPSPSGRNKYEQVSFKDFINESSLSRIKSKSDKGGIAIMSASRGDKSKKENSARGKQLDKDIRGRFGRGATKVTGSYMEKGDDGKERKVKEKSHVIDRGKMGKRKFKKAVKKLGKKYGQDSVLTQTKKSATLSATRKGGLGKAKGVNVGKFKPQGKNPEGQSQIKGKTFTYG